jgi:hypothetical protein
MISIKSLENVKKITLLSILISAPVFAEISQKEIPELPQDEIFSPKGDRIPTLQGKIENGRYYAPRNLFSCSAYDYGEGIYTVQDGLLNHGVCVGFYNAIGDFKKVEVVFLPEKVIFLPEFKNKNPNKKSLKDAFEIFGIGILKKVDNAEEIELLSEELVGDNLFFAAISVKRMSVLKTPIGQHMSSTRGYLLFQVKDKLVILSNQRVTLPSQRHIPKNHTEKLKQDILEFKKTFELDPSPISTIENTNEKGT